MVVIYRYASPLGILSYDWNEQCCRRLWLADRSDAIESGDDPVFRWLDAYFAGGVLPLPLLGHAHTPFQARLREALLSIPSGQTRSYGQLAAQLSTSPRGLGQALGANPVPLLIPCHRIVGANGMGGFSCGIEWKKRLLQFERNP